MNKKLFVEYCQKFNQNSSKLEKKLTDNNYELTDEILLLTEDLKKIINIEITTAILPWLVANIGWRGVSRPLLEKI